ncbi:MAG: 50S ribosomal protein L25 [Desulfobacteraceae bacterium]|nr:50S ribosomal protein L25 [Desulfobacteraceae bacterium]MBC2756054.1 50S ribosomal protein L25 [Desulfobacteraceae bacterium]
MEIHPFKAQTRHSTGKGTARSLRRDGKIPAVLYGSDIESIPLSISIYDIEQLLKKVNYAQALLNLKVEGGEPFEKTVMIKEIQTEPLNQNFLHMDLYEVDMKRKLTATVPIVTTGTSKGVEAGGILQIIRRELDVNCLPTEIPKQITIDITDLDIGDSIHVDEIELEGDVEIPFDANFTIMTVVVPKVVEEEVEEVEEGEEGEELEEGAEEAAAATEEDESGSKE